MANTNEKVSLTAPNGMVIKTTSKDSERWVNHFFKVGEKAREKRENNEAMRKQRWYDKFNAPTAPAAPAIPEASEAAE